MDILRNSQSLMLTGHKPALRFWDTIQRMYEVFALDLIIEGFVGIDTLISKLAFTDTLKHLKIASGKFNLLIVKIIHDFGPPHGV